MPLHRLSIHGELTVSLVVLILNLAYLCFGYDASVIGVILAMPPFIATFGNPDGPDGTSYLSATRTSVITATRTSASIPAIFVCAYCGSRFGRRITCWIGCFACLLGTAVQTGAVDVAMITVGLTVASKLRPLDSLIDK